MKATHQYATGRTCITAVNYGGRDEIIRGFQSYITQGGVVADLTAEQFGQYLDFGDVAPVDLVIRTKGDVARRLSGFMSWWIGYAELYFTAAKFPEFDISELEKALIWYDSICEERNFGK
ncbi:MAG: undecaprenyl diphosphate synthase family protein [Candidatus Peribacteria bacterium]|nr:MAG: undecaprenyl diphosphate synthase family protein [Candidatus Peribacteria bacterium]